MSESELETVSTSEQVLESVSLSLRAKRAVTGLAVVLAAITAAAAAAAPLAPATWYACS